MKNNSSKLGGYVKYHKPSLEKDGFWYAWFETTTQQEIVMEEKKGEGEK